MAIAPVIGADQPTGASYGHAALLSVALLIGAAFVAQGVADSGPGAHSLVVALIVGVVLILLMRWQTTGQAQRLAGYPWIPPSGGS